ncbi:MAG TPA: hypothetical protein VFS20_17955 [Longimicrobium sp.]|nr:hypothetical protein [Longimicrobium sp.]
MRVPSLLLRRGIVPAVLATLAAAGCSHDLTDPATAATRGALRRTASADGRPQFSSNTIKYRDAGAKPATGRSGSSTLAARALLGKDGVTQLEVTTGSFDAGSATRPLSKVQVKQLDAQGNALRTHNYNDLNGGGTASFQYEGLARGQTLQVQGNVAEPHRTAVVTVSETVHLRPDLRVRLEVPAQARVGVPVALVAAVSEGNGEVGARGDCVLYVDGVEADRAHGIWVDAGDAVSCAFNHTFHAAGEKHLRVEIAGVSPADWDPSNNTAEGDIRVTGGSDFNYFAFVEDYREQSVQVDSGWLYYDDGQRIENQQILSANTTFQTGQLTGWMPHHVSLADAQVRVSQSTAGVVAHSATWSLGAGLESGPVEGCLSLWEPGVAFHLCTSGTPENGQTDFQYLWSGYAVTYFGVSYSRFWLADAPDNVYTNTGEWTEESVSGNPLITMGPDYSFLIELTDGSRTYRTETTIPVATTESWTWTYWPPDGRLCYTELIAEIGLRWDICRYHLAQVTRRSGYQTGEAE